MPYDVNRSVSKPLEFKGLTGQYIIILAAGVVGLFILFFILKFAGINAYVTLALIGGLLGAFLVWLGEHGFDKHIAGKACPRFILRRKTMRNLLKK